jgi:hypothetical protein
LAIRALIELQFVFHISGETGDRPAQKGIGADGIMSISFSRGGKKQDNGQDLLDDSRRAAGIFAQWFGSCGRAGIQAAGHRLDRFKSRAG